MNTKRIIAALLASAVFAQTASAFTPYFPEDVNTEAETEQQESEAENKSAEEEQSPSKPSNNGNIVTPVRPANIQYELFMQMLNEYVDKHLYEFTKEEVIDKFFKDFLTENPMYLELFANYMLGTMDKYSGYYKANSNFFNVDGASKGFGIVIKEDDKGIQISEIVIDSAADHAGLKAGDRFIKIAGIDVEELTLDVVTTLLTHFDLFIEQAESETENQEAAAEPLKCPFVIERNGELLEFSVAKTPMTQPQVSSKIDENHGYPTGYIAVSSFLGENTVPRFVSDVRKFAEDGIKYLTIDLRDNSGGSLDFALEMAECFIPEGEIICYYNDKTLEEPRAVYSTNDAVKFDSITILVNENTASAAELLTSILKVKGLAKVIGKKTFGKSLGQTVYSLYNGDTFTITSYQILDETFNSYDGIGIIPDLVIDDVEMCYTLPKQLIFNHQNYVEIKKHENEYNDVTKALEDRLVIMGLLDEKYCDGIYDDVTKRTIYILQTRLGYEKSEYVTYELVSYITRTINAYKSYTYFDNTQYDVAMIVHRSFSQGKRLVVEKERLRENQAQLIKERDDALDALAEAKEKEYAAKVDAEAKENSVTGTEEITDKKD